MKTEYFVNRFCEGELEDQSVCENTNSMMKMVNYYNKMNESNLVVKDVVTRFGTFKSKSCEGKVTVTMRVYVDEETYFQTELFSFETKEKNKYQYR